jgi:hypothetical protein
VLGVDEEDPGWADDEVVGVGAGAGDGEVVEDGPAAAEAAESAGGELLAFGAAAPSSGPGGDAEAEEEGEADGTCQAVTEECVRVGMDEQALARAADLIAHDLTATLGWETGQARTEARAVLDNRAALLLPTGPSWDDLDRARQQQLLDDVVVEAVEDLQQWLHDTFVDTSWPSCVRHPHHPMWLGEGQGGGIVWCCPRDQAEIAPLGMLSGPAEPSSQHP